jgi:hypothetical protein
MSALHEVTVPRPDVPEVELVSNATRRRFTAEYTRKILRTVDACPVPGAIGALLLREGLDSSHLTTGRALARRSATPPPSRRIPWPAGSSLSIARLPG